MKITNWKDRPVGTCDCCNAILTYNNKAYSLGAQWVCGTCFDVKVEGK
jgi:hypothetical protein